MEKISYSIINDVEERHWWFRVRRELLVVLVRRFLPQGQLKILDIGCGTGLHSRILEQFGSVVSVDPAQEALEFCRQKGLKNIVEASATALPLADNTFDLVVVLDVLEHIEHAQDAVAEIQRVLKPGGLCICYVPAFQALWGKNDEVRMHFRRYRKKELSKLFSSQFWQVRKQSYFNFWLFGPIYCMRKALSVLDFYPDELRQVSALNKLLYVIFHSEIFFIMRTGLPWGVSLLGVFQKNR